MPLVLAVPGLLQPPDAPDDLRALRLPRLERWLARAKPSREAAGGLEHWLARLAGLEGDAPVAAVTLAGERGARAEGAWLRADPVHLRVGQDTVTLQEGASLAIAPEEARALAEALDAHFAPEGLRFEARAPDRWYVRIPDGAPPRTTALDDAVGRDIRERLPRSATGRNRWLAAMTEAQMVLAAHPANAAREASRRLPVNSIWLWGEGALPETIALPFGRVHANEPFARGMAVLAGVPLESFTGDLASLSPAADKHDVLAIDARPADALRRGSIDDWCAAAREVDAMLDGVGSAIARFGGVRVVLPGPRHTLVACLDSRWRWPRAAAPLSSHA